MGLREEGAENIITLGNELMKPLPWSMLDLGFLSTWGKSDVVIKLLVKGGHSPQCPDKEEEFYFSRQEQPEGIHYICTALSSKESTSVSNWQISTAAHSRSNYPNCKSAASSAP